MKEYLKIFFISSGLFGAVLSGCYTQLMTPQEYLRSQHERPVIAVNSSSDISYTSNCLSCHSKMELDDRYFDMKAYGVTTAHGYVIDPSMWNNPYADVYEPPYFPGGPVAPMPPWWLPPPVIVIGGGQPVQEQPKKKRADNPSRGNNKSEEREQPVPTYTTPPTPPAPSTTNSGIPAVTTTQQPQTQTAPATRPQSPQSGGTDSNNNTSGSKAPTKKRSD